MASPSWLCLGGAEIVNACRATAYAAAGWGPPGVELGCGCCSADMGKMLLEDNGNYNNPWTDKAPWLSTSEEVSYEFGGFLPLSVEGLGPGPITRGLTQRANGRGSFIGPALQSAPTITVTGILFGQTCCSVDYGFRWLSTMLQGSCDSDCDGDELTFLDCCPEVCDDADEPNFHPAKCLTPHLRYLRGVQLVSSPTIVQRFGGGSGCCNGGQYMQIQFQLAASHPCVYRDPVTIIEGQELTDESTICEWVLVDPGTECTEPECIEPDDCLADPNCNQVPKPPTAPKPVNPCVCDPVQTSQACVTIPAGSIPEYTEGLPLLTIRSGSRALQQVRVKFWNNPFGLPVDQLDPCNACGEVTLSRIPADSVFVFDGSERTATITCPGSAPTDATPLMGSAGGTLPLSWPEIQCAESAYTMCVDADLESASIGASFDLAIIPTECFG
jgi:hypothetical protein